MGRPSKYPAEFREQAVELVKASGKTVAEVARDLKINDTTLGNWVKADRAERRVPDETGLLPLAQTRELHVDRARAGVPLAGAVALAAVDPHLAAGAVRGAAQRVARRHQRLHECLQQVPDEVGFGTVDLLVPEQGRSILGRAVIVLISFSDFAGLAKEQ